MPSSHPSLGLSVFFLFLHWAPKRIKRRPTRKEFDEGNLPAVFGPESRVFQSRTYPVLCEKEFYVFETLSHNCQQQKLELFGIAKNLSLNCHDAPEGDPSASISREGTSVRKESGAEQQYDLAANDRSGRQKSRPCARRSSRKDD